MLKINGLGVVNGEFLPQKNTPNVVGSGYGEQEIGLVVVGRHFLESEIHPDVVGRKSLEPKSAATVVVTGLREPKIAPHMVGRDFWEPEKGGTVVPGNFECLEIGVNVPPGKKLWCANQLLSRRFCG